MTSSSSDDYPGDAAYAKISLVDENQRQLVDAHELMDQYTGLKQLFDFETRYHVGAYSVDSTLIVDIAKFVDACYLVSTNPTAAPHDALYLANATDIRGSRYEAKGSNIPPSGGKIWWSLLKDENVKSYVAQVSKAEQMNLQEAQTSDLGAGAEIALNVLMAASLVPYVGPFLSTVGSAEIEGLTNVKVDSSAGEA
ncbi:hypothetical protein BO94DRAFT_582504 [Aspergillus sclerotioniger CBS 115572]|uniref:Uncharacterized protein n=1 Tax=Aspergillus sclerotioniger CBS 115572 TaxID=1450535 RepID=A0A317XC32_9EURO|nr:hypothetical protein BO94DRAFT_582504 [Aspergillus sclerotioniger CBS 115572]PWY94100.1 hypothetical protein BO94DRAFT_582504 [Aspergillus sclerotioniger CBS 115572]